MTDNIVSKERKRFPCPRCDSKKTHYTTSNENLQHQKSALIFYKSAGIISEREYEILFNSIIRLERVNDNALEEKERFLPDVEITEKYSF